MSFVFAARHKDATFRGGCLSVRLSVLDRTRARTAPGPIYNPKPRVSSQERSLRDISFGTARARYNDEPQNSKGRILTNKNPPPGPQTYDPNAIREAVYKMSRHRNVAGVKFGTGKRACNAELKCTSPSPAEYDPDAIRRGVMQTKSGTTHIKFGTALGNICQPCEKPGPQTYDPEAIRRGIMFTKGKQSTIIFGTPTGGKTKSRKQRKKEIPGPQQYETESIRRGINSLSTKKRPASVKFTTGPRTYNDAEEKERSSKPGPSVYEIPSALGRQVNSKYKSQPSISFGSR